MLCTSLQQKLFLRKYILPCRMRVAKQSYTFCLRGILHGGFLFPRAASQVCMQACIFGSLQAQNPLDLAHDLSVKFQGGQFYVRDDPEQAHEAGEYSQQ